MTLCFLTGKDKSMIFADHKEEGRPTDTMKEPQPTGRTTKTKRNYSA